MYLNLPGHTTRMRRCGSPPKIRIMLHQPDSLESLAMAVLGRRAAAGAESLARRLRPDPPYNRRSNDPPIPAGPDDLTPQEQRLLTEHMQHFQTHISALPYDLHNRLLTELLSAVRHIVIKIRILTKWMRAAFESMIETFLTSRLTVLTLDEPVSINMCFELLCARARHLTRLTHLKLQPMPYRLKPADRPDLQRDIIRIIKELHALKYLSLKGYCTDDILKCVVENCPLIEELNLSLCGTHVSDHSMPILTRLPRLTSICLSGTSVGRNGVETLIFNCENLEHVEPSGIVAMSLGYSDTTRQRYAGKVFKLKSCDTGASANQLDMLAEVCPHIQHMTIRKCENDERCNLTSLTRFNFVRHLKLSGYRFYDDRLTDTLQKIGPNLLNLQLDLVHQIDLDALKEISQLCPHLRELSIVSCGFSCQRSLKKKLEIPPFRQLKRLNWRILNSVSELRLLLFLLSSSLNVECVKIMASKLLVREDFLLSVLDQNPLRCLEELEIQQPLGFWVTQETFTQHVLDRIVQHGSRPAIIRSIQ